MRAVLLGIPEVRDRYDVVFTRRAEEFAAMRPRIAAVIKQVTHGWDGFTLTQDDLPAGATIIRYPAALLMYPWPLMTPSRRQPDRSARHALFPYTICDSLVEELIAKGVEKRNLLDAYHAVDITKRFPLDRLQKISEAKSRQIDALSDFSITDQMMDGQAMRTANHPNGPLFSYMLQQVIGRLPVEPAVIEDAERQAPVWAKGVGIQNVEAPVHPQVADHFGLDWAKDRLWNFWYEGDFTYDERILRLYDRWYCEALSEGRAMNKRGENAADLLAKAVEELPNSIDARAQLSSALLKAGRTSEAIDSYMVLLTMEPTAANRLRLVSMLRRAGRREEADAVLAANDSSPSQTEAPGVGITDEPGRSDHLALHG